MRRFEIVALTGLTVLAVTGFAGAQQAAAPLAAPAPPAASTPPGPTTASPGPALTSTLATRAAPPSTATVPTTPAPAPPTPAPPAPANIEPGAQTILLQMADAYKALKSFSAAITIDHAMDSRHQTIEVAMKLVRPNRARILVSAGGKSGMLQSDGKSLFMMVPDSKTKYLKRPAPTDPNALAEILSTLGVDSYIVPLLAGYGPMDLYKGTLRSAVLDPAGMQGGVAVDRVSIGLQKDSSHATVLFSIGHDDHLLREVVGRFPQGATGHDAVVTEIHAQVMANPLLPDATFIFTPPKGASEMSMPEAPPPTPYNPRLRVGAAPLEFTATDTAGKLVSLGQYKGKVLLLDFWASSFPPSVAQVPALVAAYKRYHVSGLEIVGISLDGKYQPFAAFRASHDMPWREILDIGPHPIAELYQPQTLPLVVVVGRDGKVAAIDPPPAGLAQAVASAVAHK